LEKARIIQHLCRLLRLEGAWLPDGVIFLDLSPTRALCRIAFRGQKVDKHENEADLTQAREMYLKTVEALRKYKRTAAVHRIVVDDLSPGDALHATLEALRPGILAHREAPSSAEIPLGTTSTNLTGGAVWRKVFSYRYIFRYVLAKWLRGAWRELTFVFSKLGRLLLKEGYSAAVMRTIYDQDEKDYGLLDRIFLAYPLHRAVYDRLQILTRRIELELEGRLNSGQGVRIFTAPCGFAYDLFRPLAKIRSEAPELIREVEIVAVDLDPHGIPGRRASRARSGPGRRHPVPARGPDGRVDRRQGPSNGSVRYRVVRRPFQLVAQGLRAAVESGRDTINHVLIASPHLARRELANSTTY
jgi:hypothetical protein